MPIVTISLMRGRDPEKIQDMIRGVSRAIAEALDDAPIERVRVMVHEMEELPQAAFGDQRPAALARTKSMPNLWMTPRAESS